MSAILARLLIALVLTITSLGYVLIGPRIVRRWNSANRLSSSSDFDKKTQSRRNSQYASNVASPAKDLAQVERAINDLLGNHTPSQDLLIKVLVMLDSCRAPPMKIVYWWNRLTALGSVPTARAVRSLLAQCLSRGRDDHMNLKDALKAVLLYPPWDPASAFLWTTTSCNLFLQIAFAVQRVEDADRLALFLLPRLAPAVHGPRAPSPPTITEPELQPDETTLTILIKGYGAIGDVEKAQLAFKEFGLLSPGPSSSPSKPSRDAGATLRNALLSVFAQHGMADEAEALVNQSAAQGLKWDAYTLNILLGLYADLQNLPQCRGLWKTHKQLLLDDSKLDASAAVLLDKNISTRLQSDISISTILHCPADRAGVVIGTRGANVKAVMARSNTTIRLNMNSVLPLRNTAGGMSAVGSLPFFKVVVSGSPAGVEEARRLLNAVIAQGPGVLSNSSQPQRQPQSRSHPTRRISLGETRVPIDKAASIGYSIFSRALTDAGQVEEALALLVECPAEAVGTAIAYALGRRTLAGSMLYPSPLGKTGFREEEMEEGEATAAKGYLEVFRRVSSDVRVLERAERTLGAAGSSPGVLGLLLSSLMTGYTAHSSGGDGLSSGSTHAVLAYFLAYHSRDAVFGEMNEYSNQGRGGFSDGSRAYKEKSSDANARMLSHGLIGATSKTAFMSLTSADIFGNLRAATLLLQASAVLLTDDAAEPRWRLPVFSSRSSLWAFLRALLLRRAAAASRKSRLLDDLAVDAAFRACGATGDVAFASQLLAQLGSLSGSRFRLSPSTTGNPVAAQTTHAAMPALSLRLLHTYLRCFSLPAHGPLLDTFLVGMKTSSRREGVDHFNYRSGGAVVSEPSPAEFATSGRPVATDSFPTLVGILRDAGLQPDTRLYDELVNSALRVWGLPEALALAARWLMGEARGRLYDWKNKPSNLGLELQAVRAESDLVSEAEGRSAAVQNLLIYFDRYWRDIAAPAPETFEPLPIESKSSDVSSLLRIKATLFASAPSGSGGRRSCVDEGRVLLGVLLHPLPSSVTAAISSQNTLLSTPPPARLRQLMGLAAVLAAWLARGEHRAFREGVIALQGNGDGGYSRHECALVLELALFSALGADFPLLDDLAPAALSRFLSSRLGPHEIAAVNTGQAQSPPVTGVAATLALVPHQARLAANAASLRMTCTLNDALDCLEMLATESVECSQSSSGERTNLPAISAVLLQTLFDDAVAYRKAPAARRIVALLAGGIDVVLSGPNQNLQGEGEAEGEGEDDPARALARRWTAQLVGRSLNAVSTRVGVGISALIDRERGKIK